METIKNPGNPILLVDDDAPVLHAMNMTLRSMGFNNIVTCEDGRKVLSILAENEIEVVLLDVIMPYITGEQLLPEIIAADPDLPVIMVTAVNEVETAVTCMKNGAMDYLVKPIDRERLISTMRQVVEIRDLRRMNLRLTRTIFSDTLKNPKAFSEIVTNSQKMKAVFQYCEAVAPSRQPVIITGETGVGKELIARALHQCSGRRGNFVAVNIAGLDDHAFSDTLFGHTKGAFTGADQFRKGLVERAAGGTFFMDEIGDLSEALQIKLLRLLQENEYYPLGSDFAKPTDARFILATQQDLETLMAQGRFRRDLYYRMRTHYIRVPPLRERKDDLPLLVSFFLQEAARDLNKPIPNYPPELITLLAAYHFPGNIRELRAMVFEAASNHKSRLLSLEVFRRHIDETRGLTASLPLPLETGELTCFSSFLQLPTLKECQQLLIREAMRRSNDNQSVAAHLLGVTPQALNARLKRSS
jgi:DNA-binding NtrC family response regulator